MDTKALHTEISTDPLSLGYLPGSVDNAYTLLTTKNRSVTDRIPSLDLHTWSAGFAAPSADSRIERITEASVSGPAKIKGIAQIALRILRREDAGVDIANPQHIAMIDGLVAGGVLTTADKTALVTLGTKSVTRAEELGLSGLTKQHIRDTELF